jgi:hypothetical protein
VHVREQSPRLREAEVVAVRREHLDRLFDRRDGDVAPALVGAGSELQQQSSQACIGGEACIVERVGGGGRLIEEGFGLREASEVDQHLSDLGE